MATKVVQYYLTEVVIAPTSSKMTAEFGRGFKALHQNVKNIVHGKYHRWRKDPASLNFHPDFGPYCTVRIEGGIRALARVNGGEVTWMAIGDHQYYDRILDMLRKGR